MCCRIANLCVRSPKPIQINRKGKEMQFVKWTKEYEIGLLEIDEQHERLVELLNKLYDASRRGLGEPALHEVLGELRDYSNYHFTLEERKMSQAKYPGLADQIRAHGEFISHLDKVELQIKSNEIDLPAKLAVFLFGWLVCHINDTDRKFAEFVLGQKPQVSEEITKCPQTRDQAPRILEGGTLVGKERK